MKKSKWKQASAVFLAICLLVPLAGYIGYYAYWGRRNALLWKVETVTVTPAEQKENSVILTYEGTVRNWPHDFIKHHCILYSYLGGEPCIWSFDVLSNDGTDFGYHFTSERKEKPFSFQVLFDLESVIPYGDALTVKDLLKDAIEISRFLPDEIDKNGNVLKPRKRSLLYMAGSPDASIRYELPEDFMATSVEKIYTR